MCGITVLLVIGQIQLLENTNQMIRHTIDSITIKINVSEITCMYMTGVNVLYFTLILPLGQLSNSS